MENSFSVEREHCRNGHQCNPCRQLHTINVRPLFTFPLFNQKQTLAEVTRLPLQKHAFYHCKNKLDIPLLVSGWQHHDWLWIFQNVRLTLTKCAISYRFFLSQYPFIVLVQPVALHVCRVLPYTSTTVTSNTLKPTKRKAQWSQFTVTCLWSLQHEGTAMWPLQGFCQPNHFRFWPKTSSCV